MNCKNKKNHARKGFTLQSVFLDLFRGGLPIHLPRALPFLMFVKSDNNKKMKQNLSKYATRISN